MDYGDRTLAEMRAKLAAASTLIDDVYRACRAGEAVDPVWGFGWETGMYLNQARRRLRLAERALARHEDPRNVHAVPAPARIRESR